MNTPNTEQRMKNSYLSQQRLENLFSKVPFHLVQQLTYLYAKKKYLWLSTKLIALYKQDFNLKLKKENESTLKWKKYQFIIF